MLRVRNSTIAIALMVLSGAFFPRALAQVPDYIDKLGNLDCRNCYFLVLNVASPDYSGRVVIENDDMYLYMTETAGLDEKGYKEFIREHLLSVKPILLNTASVDKDSVFLQVGEKTKHNFRLLRANEKLNSFIAKGCRATLDFYFEKENTRKAPQDCKEYLNKFGPLSLRIALDSRDEASLIAALFDWKILVRIDDLSGYLRIE